MAVGKPIPMLDASDRVTGTVPYAVNLQLPDMLVAKILRSPLPHARIVEIDTSRAEQLPGVVTVLTAADLDQSDGPELTYGMIINDQPVVAHDRVRYIGEPVAIVAAENSDIAKAALALIEVEYEEQPSVYEATSAMQSEASTLHGDRPDNCFRHVKLRRGDLEAAFAAADEIIEETYTSPAANHVTLEPHVTAAQWQEGGLTIWTASQSPYTVRRVVAELFRLEPEAIRIIVPPLGGGYGGKGHVRLEPLVAALAWKVGGRPVKLTLKREEEFVTVTKHAATITMKSGVKQDGTFTARQATVHWNAGAYAGESPLLVQQALVRSLGPYRIPVIRADSYGIYTNLPPAGAFRGAMSSQTTWAYESHMDTIAHRLGLDPLAFRLKNLLCSGDQFATGEIMHDIHFVECLRACADKLGWQKQATDKNEGALKRGRGLAVMMKSTIPNSKSECRLRINSEGQITLFTSTVEMGQGAHTAMAQITATAMEVSVDSISLVGPDTAQTPFDTTTAAARSTGMMGTAILSGAVALKQKLIEAAVPVFEHPPEELSAGDGCVFITAQPDQRVSYADILRRHQYESLEARGEFHTNEGTLDPETGQGVSTPHWHQGAGACEIEVDTETGKVAVLRYYGASYAGQVVNPKMARLQNDGNVIFGLGPATLEEVVFDEGQIINASLADYNVPSFLDIPHNLDNVALESEKAEFHGIGEMTLPPVAPAIANAIYDALGVRIRDLPLTPEKVLRALHNDGPKN